MAAPNDFLIAAQATGTNPDNWSVVSTLLSSVSGDISSTRSLDWTYKPYSQYVKLASGKTRGVGFPVVTWTFGALRPEQRENLRDFCTDTSSDVYIRTAIVETTSGARAWDDFSAIMNWVTREEIIGVNYVEQVEITFTHLVAI